MAQIVSSPNANTGKNSVLLIQKATTEIKDIIAAKGNTANADIQKVIDACVAEIAKTDKNMARNTYNTLIKSANNWMYTYVYNTNVVNQMLLFDIQKTIKRYSGETGLSETNRAYTADLMTLADEVKNGANPNKRAVVDRFRGNITEQEHAIPFIENYDKLIRSQVKLLASETPQMTYTDTKGKPRKMSLRNRVEAAARYSQNLTDVANLKYKGTKLVWTSSHADASPRCAPWQGRLYSLDGTSGKTKDGISFEPIENALSANEGNSIINGYNCRHYLIEYTEGSKPPKDYSHEEIQQEYAVDLRQRNYENQIRSLKSEEACFRASGDLDKAKKLRLQWRAKTAEYEAYSLKNGRAYYPWRTMVEQEEIDLELGR